MAETRGGVQWREWGEAAFAEARAQDRPILLDIGAVWCHWCHVMDEGIPGDPVHTGTYASPHVQRRIAEGFVPIKVDNDQRPDINARYNMGGWPTTAFLTPDGDTLYGETYVPPTRMVGLLDYIADLWKNNRAQITEQTLQARAQRALADTEAASAPPSHLDPDTVPNVLTHLTRQFDPVYGGFGTQPKFPHPAALRLALEQYDRTGDAALREVAEKTLAGMAGGGMYDQHAGGFFRYSTTRDWSIPHYEKMLEDNARLTEVYALASTALEDPRWLGVVRSAQGWLLSEMRAPETGAFAGSQDADAEEHYYGHPLSVRATLPTPFIDRTVYAGWNALMVSALVARYQLTGENDILEAARQTLSFLGQQMSDPQAPEYVVLRHYWREGTARGSAGLLQDQTAFIGAALDIYEATGDSLLLAAARGAGDYLLGVLQDAAHGGFFDIAPETGALGELARPKKDMAENAEAAIALVRLSALTEDPRFHQTAARALTPFAAEYASYGYHAAAYARAVDAVTRPPLHVVIVGTQGHPALWPLQQAAWNVPAPGKAVEWLEDGAPRGFPAAPGGGPRAYVCVGTNCKVLDDPNSPEWKTILTPSERA